jgi:hypothetical protein
MLESHIVTGQKINRITNSNLNQDFLYCDHLLKQQKHLFHVEWPAVERLQENLKLLCKVVVKTVHLN